MPARFWWLKVASAVFVIVILALVGLRMWWGYEAQRRLDAAIAAAHARGEGIVPEDFNFPPVPDGRNAAVAITAAGKSVKVTPAQEQWDNNFDPLESPTVNDLVTLRAIVNANGAALAGAREARRRRAEVNWNLHFISPVMNTLLRYLSDAHELNRMLTRAAIYQHAIGDDADAIETLRDQLAAAEAVEKSVPFMVCHSSSGAMAANCCDAVAGIAATLDVADARGVIHAATTRPAGRHQVAALIDELLDERSFTQGLIDAWIGERMMYLDCDTGVGSRQFWLQAEPLLRPASIFNAVRSVEFYNRAIAASREAANYPSAVKSAPDDDERRRLQSPLQALVRQTSTRRWSISGAFRQHLGVVTERRAAALLLALRLYQLDHAGALPATLQELVPAYVKSVPPDPFAAAPRPMAYRAATATTRPAVYSIGVDGKDDGGKSRRWGLVWKDTGYDEPVYELAPPPPPRLVDQP